MSQQNDNQKMLAGFVMGAAAGAAAVLLLAPPVSEETKQKIADKVSPLKNLFSNNLDQFLQYGLTALTAYIGKATHAVEQPVQDTVHLLDKQKKSKGHKEKKAGKKKNKDRLGVKE